MSDEFGDIFPEPQTAQVESSTAPQEPQPGDMQDEFGELFP